MLNRPTTTRLDDTNEIVMTGFADDVKFPAPIVIPPLPSANNTLSLNNLNTEYLGAAANIVFNGVFYVELTAQNLIQNGTYIPLFGDTSVTNRVLLSGASSLIAVNLGGASLITKPITVDVNLIHTYKLYRDALNDVYFQVDSETPIFISNNALAFTIRNIGKAHSAFKITGVIHSFNLNGDLYDLSEGTGNLLSHNNGTTNQFTINSTAGLTHINEQVWTVAPPETASIQVISKGVGGNNAVQMLARFDADVTPNNPDLVFVLAGTNDVINSGNNLTPTVFKSTLLELINKTILIGATPVIWNIPPVIDSYKKADHDYTLIYGDESTYDLNTDILDGMFRTKIAELQTETGVAVFDVKSVFTANGDPAIFLESFLRNELNAGGETDGVHFTSQGRQSVASGMVSFCTGKTKIVLLGDSNTAFGGGDSIGINLSLLLNS